MTNLMALARLILLIFAILATFTALPVRAADDTSATRLENVVVTGTKTATPLGDGPVKVDLLRAREIEKKRYRGLEEAIFDIPGINATGSMGRENSSAVVQGLSGDRVLVMVDDVPLAQNASGGFDLNQISANQIERIEVIKGGSSSLYGGQAMGGVIHVITKKAKTPLKFSVEMQQDLIFEGQKDRDLSLIAADVRSRQDKNSYRMTTQRKSQKSADLNAQSITRDTPDSEKWTAQVGASHDLNSRHSFAADYWHFAESNRSYTAKLNSEAGFDPVWNDSSSQTHRLKLSTQSAWSDRVATKFYLFGEKADDKLALEDNPETEYRESEKSSELEHQRAELQTDLFLGQHVWTVGAVGDLARLDTVQETRVSADKSTRSNEVEDRHSQLVEGYVQDDWTLGNWEVVSGLRVSRDLTFAPHWSPKINISRKLAKIGSTDSIWRTSYGTGYRIPTLKERYYILDHRSFAGYTVTGNEDLKAETSQSYQSGLEFTSGRDWNANAGVFLNEIRDMVTTAELPSSTSERRFQFVNLDRVRIYGLEASGGYRIRGPWNAQHSFTYTHAEDIRSGLIIADRPFYIGSTSLQFSSANQKTDVFLIGRYFGESYANVENTEKNLSYWQLDLRANQRLDKNFSVFFGVLNILNQRRDPLGDLPITDRPGFGHRPALGTYALIGLKGEG